ncbi:MAG: protein kinase, partial [Gemmatimonadaceae bacterium]
MTSTQTPDTVSLDALADRYEIIGELAGRRGIRSYIARRKDTGADVLVSVFRQPEGDEGNALNHLASDANRLSESSHPNLVALHESRWLANDTLALVTDRVRHPTLEEMLIRRNEEFSCPRVAMVLRDINGALEWAREMKIVHRHVDPSSIFVLPGNDRVMLSFVLRPLPLADMPGAEDDARTIATLARAMLTRSVADPERDQLPLGELRPGLPDRLIQQTDQLLHPDSNESTPDVSEYIATVAMAEALKRGETECAETTRKLLEEERIAREKIEGERAATEHAAAEQARLFQLEREAFAKEREGILAELQKQREVLERERAMLARERAEHHQDRELLERERDEHRRWADEVERAFAAQSAALEQQTRAAQERVVAERAEIQRLVEERVAEELAARLPKDPESPAGDKSHARLVTKPKKVKSDGTEIAVPLVLPRRPKHHRVTPQWVRAVSHVWSDARARLPEWKRPAWNRKWNVPAAAATVLLLVVLSAVAIARARDGGDGIGRSPVASAERVTDSAAGRVEAPSAEPRV